MRFCERIDVEHNIQ